MSIKPVETIEVTQAIWNTAKRLEHGVDIITQKAKDYAENERKYRIALSKEIMKLKSEKVPVSIIGDVARGNVADDKFNRDLAQEVYKSSKCMLQALQTETNALQSILKVQTNIER